MFPSLELKKILQVHVLSFYTILKKSYQSAMKTFTDKKNRGGGIKKKKETKKQKNKTKKPPHSLLETEDLNDLIWG